MEEEIVSLKTAKLLKEKGFDESLSKGCPTQNIVQRWFREVHNIVILIGCVCDFRWIDLNCTGESKATVEYWDYDITVAEKWLYDNTIHSANKFDTYEDALEDAIEKALTLI